MSPCLLEGDRQREEEEEGGNPGTEQGIKGT